MKSAENFVGHWRLLMETVVWRPQDPSRPARARALACGAWAMLHRNALLAVARKAGSNSSTSRRINKAFDYRNYRLADDLAKHEQSISNYIVRMRSKWPHRRNPIISTKPVWYELFEFKGIQTDLRYRKKVCNEKIVAEMNSKIMHIAQLSGAKPFRYAAKQAARTLWCRDNSRGAE